MLTLSPGDYITIAQTAFGLLQPYNDMSRQARSKVKLAEERRYEIRLAKNPRDILNRILDYLIEAHKLQKESIFLWPLWDGNYISPSTQIKFKELNRICVSIANTFYEIGETDLAKDWLFRMDSRGEYEKSSIPIFKKILGYDYDKFQRDFMDASDRYIESREETRDELRNRPFFF